MDWQLFERTLQSLLSPQNEERNAAEASLKTFVADANAFLPLLLQALRTSQHVQVSID